MVTHGLLGTYRGNMVQRGGQRLCVEVHKRSRGGIFEHVWSRRATAEKKQHYKQVQEDNKNNTNNTAKNAN